MTVITVAAWVGSLPKFKLLVEACRESLTHEDAYLALHAVVHQFTDEKFDYCWNLALRWYSSATLTANLLGVASQFSSRTIVAKLLKLGGNVNTTRSEQKLDPTKKPFLLEGITPLMDATLIAASKTSNSCCNTERIRKPKILSAEPL